MNFNEQLNKGKEILGSSIKRAKNTNLSDIKKSWNDFTKRLPDISHLKNVVLFSILALLLILVFFYQRFSALDTYLPKKPVDGGVYQEGVVGKIEQLNPLYSPLNSAESSATALLFSGLTKKDGMRKSVPDLAEKWEISADERTYTFHLRKNAAWHDGSKLTADDVVFTVDTVQNPDARSPLLEAWKGVDVQKTDDSTVVFKLSSPYTPFLAGTDLPIIPKHILEIVPARSLRVAEFGLKPIGSGPFKFREIKKIKDSQEVVMDVNEKFYSKTPYLLKMIIKSYPDYKQMVEGYSKREILGMEKINATDLKSKSNFPGMKVYSLSIPEYDALYFNVRNEIIKDKPLRESIALAVDRKKIINEVYDGEAEPIATPILPGYTGSNSKLKGTFDLNAAKEKLKASGYGLDGKGVLRKGDTVISLRLVTSDDAKLGSEAERIKNMIMSLGIDVKVEKYPLAALAQDYIRPRNFDLLLISQNLGADSDLYAFWHSTQTNNPGLNFSGFSDRKLDKFIEQARTTSDPKLRNEKYQGAIQIIWSEVPAIFTVWPHYLYGVSEDVKGLKPGKLVEPKNRFWDIANWYILDKRTD